MCTIVWNDTDIVRTICISEGKRIEHALPKAVVHRFDYPEALYYHFDKAITIDRVHDRFKYDEGAECYRPG
jgi:hypothetical protein